MNQQQYAKWRNIGAQHGRAYGEKGRNDRPRFGGGRDGELAESAWLEGFEEGVASRKRA